MKVVSATIKFDRVETWARQCTPQPDKTLEIAIKSKRAKKAKSEYSDFLHLYVERLMRKAPPLNTFPRSAIRLRLIIRFT